MENKELKLEPPVKMQGEEIDTVLHHEDHEDDDDGGDEKPNMTTQPNQDEEVEADAEEVNKDEVEMEVDSSSVEQLTTGEAETEESANKIPLKTQNNNEQIVTEKSVRTRRTKTKQTSYRLTRTRKPNTKKIAPPEGSGPENPIPRMKKGPQKMDADKRKKPMPQTLATYIIEAVRTCKGWSGISYKKIKEYLVEKYKVDVERSQTRLYINKFLNNASDAGVLFRIKGKGACATFRLPTKTLVHFPAGRKKVRRSAKKNKEKESESEIEDEDKELIESLGTSGTEENMQIYDFDPTEELDAPKPQLRTNQQEKSSFVPRPKRAYKKRVKVPTEEPDEPIAGPSGTQSTIDELLPLPKPPAKRVYKRKQKANEPLTDPNPSGNTDSDSGIPEDKPLPKKRVKKNTAPADPSLETNEEASSSKKSTRTMKNKLPEPTEPQVIIDPIEPTQVNIPEKSTDKPQNTQKGKLQTKAKMKVSTLESVSKTMMKKKGRPTKDMIEERSYEKGKKAKIILPKKI